MDKKSIESELSEYITALTGYDGDVKADTKLSDMNIDSISLVKIFVFIERNFSISLLNEGVTRDEIETFGSLVNYIDKTLSA